MIDGVIDGGRVRVGACCGPIRSGVVALDRAEGWRYLSRLTRVALEMMLEHSNPDFPVFYQASHTTVKIGADNPDNIYLNATVAPDRTYRLRGRRGTVPYLSFGTKANRYAPDGTMASTGELDARQMSFAADGSFEVVASREKMPGNWLPMEKDTSMLIVRQTFLDRTRETPAQVAIGSADLPRRSRSRCSSSNVDRAARLRSCAARPARSRTGFRDSRRRRTRLRRSNRASTMPRVVKLDNYWMESLNYRYLRAHVNSHTAKYEPDGLLKVVNAARDPGTANFLDTAGHRSGITMLLRWTCAKSHPVPRCTVTNLAALERR